MPNGYHGSLDKWQELESPLLQIDHRLSSFSGNKKIRIEKNYHNWPGRSLQWLHLGIHRQIQIYLENEENKTYNLWVCAYLDKNGTRYWKNQFLKKNTAFSVITESLETLLEEGVSLAESWLEKNLEKGPNILQCQ